MNVLPTLDHAALGIGHADGKGRMTIRQIEITEVVSEAAGGVKVMKNFEVITKTCLSLFLTMPGLTQSR